MHKYALMLYHHLTSLLTRTLAPLLVTLIVYCLILFLANLDGLGGIAIQQHMQLLDLHSIPPIRFVSIKVIFPALLSQFVRGIALCVLSLFNVIEA